MQAAGRSSLIGKKVLVTGGAGFIGSHLCEELVRIGAEVLCMDDFSAGHERNIAFLREHDNFKAIQMNVCAKDGMDEVFDGCDTVFHNAASKKTVCLRDPAQDLQVNAGGVLNLLEFSRKHGVRKFVHASTGSVYGEPTIFPTREDHPLRPVSHYGVSKLAGERYVDVYHRLYGLNTTILRYFHVYGPRQESNEFGGVVSIFLRNILEGRPLTVSGDGCQMRSFTWVGDLVQANLLAAEAPVARGEVYNAASGIQVSVNDLAQRLVQLMGAGKRIEIVHGDPLIGDILRFDVSNEKICNDLGLTFKTDFWKNLEKTIQDFIEYLKGAGVSIG